MLPTPADSLRHAARMKRQDTEHQEQRALFEWAAYARTGALYGALWIEMKTEAGRLSPAQRWWRDALFETGHAWALCRSWVEARDTIRSSPISPVNTRALRMPGTIRAQTSWRANRPMQHNRASVRRGRPVAGRHSGATPTSCVLQRPARRRRTFFAKGVSPLACRPAPDVITPTALR